MTENPPASDRAFHVLSSLDELRLSETKLLRHLTERSGLKENDLSTLRFLRESEQREIAVGPKSLAAHLGITSASVTVLLDRLENRGLATRSPSPEDRRSLRLRVTPAGLDAVASHDDPVALQGVLDDLDDQASSMLEAFFRDLAAAAKTVHSTQLG